MEEKKEKNEYLNLKEVYRIMKEGNPLSVSKENLLKSVADLNRRIKERSKKLSNEEKERRRLEEKKQRELEEEKRKEEEKKEEAIANNPEEDKKEEAIEVFDAKEEEKKEEKVEEKKEEIKEEVVEEVVETKEEVKEEKVEEKKEENKNQDQKQVKGQENKSESKQEKKPEPKKPSGPVIQDTDNPNIKIIDGKRVYVPTPEPLKQNKGKKDNKDRQNGQNGKGGQKPEGNNGKNAGVNDKTKKAQVGQGGQKKGSFEGTATTVFVPPQNNNNNNSKKKNQKNNEKPFEDKKVNKKALAKEQYAQGYFDDENDSGYRKVRKKEKKAEEKKVQKIEKAVITKEILQIKELSEVIGVQAIEITKMLFKEGIMKTINDSIDYDTAGFIAASLGIELELKLDKTAEDVLTDSFNEEADDESLLQKRSPVVTVMGHVDHGKTSILDKIRNSHVTDGEAGGITQHIGAYTVSINGERITFLDTPGHAAFTAMRARGAQITDIAIIVVAADDGIMPQTIEAINHAKAAGVSIIVAANKIDKPTADLDRVRKGLADQSVLVEDWGGDIPLVPVSAKTGEGIDTLLETILLTAEMMELKANPDRMAKGVIVEAKLDKGKGPVATVLVQSGTLKVGDYLVAGTITGKVRAMIDDKGRNVKTAGPSTPVSVLGLDEVPNAGDSLFAVEEAKLSTLVATERRNKEREEMIKNQQKVSLEELFSKVSTGDLKNLNIIIKADVQGSVEAVKGSLSELSNEEVKVNVIHAGVGAISETDVSLADSSNSIIIGFNVRPDSKAKELAERSKIEIKLYRIIYEAIEDIQNALKGMLAPKFEDVYLGKAEVRDTFKISGVGTVAGCYVVDGIIERSGKLRIYRNDVMICEGAVLQLKRFKDDVKEVRRGFECGLSINGFDDIKIGDFIECYKVEEKKA